MGCRRRFQLLTSACTTILTLALPAHACADPESAWGVSPSAALSYNPQRWAQPMAEAGVGWVRGFHTDGLASVAPLQEAGLSICGILMWSPTQPPTFPAHGMALDKFRSYVIEQVKAYRGVVTHWEVWNEPPNFSVDSSAASYGKVVAAAYDAAKSVDPNVKIGLAAKSVHLQFLAESIRKGAKDKFDFVTLHPYETVSLLPQGWEGPYLGIAANVRAMLRDKNPSKADVPIWFTEIGMEATPRGPNPVSEALQADTLVKLYTMGFAQGITRIHWFDPQDSEGHSFGLLRADSTTRPAYRALHELVKALGRNPKFLGYIPTPAGAYSFLFAGPSHDVLIAWARSQEHPTILKLPEPVEIIDPGRGSRETNAAVTLGAEPLLLKAPRDSRTAKAWRNARNQSRPQWDPGSERHSVSFQAGAHTRGVRAIGPLTTHCEDDRCELDLNKHIGARFAVDPLFQGYTSQTLEVVLTLRPHGSDHAGFNLKYEVQGITADDHGMASIGGWNFVRGDEPITLRFTLRNPSFVGKYGANLAVDCDSVKFCDFGVVSLQISKR